MSRKSLFRRGVSASADTIGAMSLARFMGSSRSRFVVRLLGTLSLIGPVALAIPTPASAQIFQPGTQPVGETDGLVIPLQRTALCTRCHATYAADVDPTVTPPHFEPWDSWRGTMMGNAGRDPVFRAALSIAEEDEPDAADFCVRCHSPPAWMRGRSTRPDYDPAAAMGDEPRFRPDPLDVTMSPSDDLDGVACAACHRMTDQTDAQIHNAQLVLADNAEADIRRGPYTYTTVMPSLRSRATTPNRCRISSSVRLAVGSSSTSMVAFWARPRAMVTMRCSATLRSPTATFGSMSTSRRAITSAA